MTAHTLLFLLTGEEALRAIIHTPVIVEEVVFCTLLTEAVLITFGTVNRAAMALFVVSIIALWTVALAGVIQQKILHFTTQTFGGSFLAGCALRCARLTRIILRKPSRTLDYTHSFVQIKATATPLALFGILACHTPLHAVLTLSRGLVAKRTRRTACHAGLLSRQKPIWVAAAAVFFSCTIASLTDGVAKLTFILTAPVVILRAHSEPPVLQTLPVLQCESVFAGVTVIRTWPSTGTTVTVTRLTLLALLIHEEAFFTMIHTLSSRDIESILTKVALGLVTDLTVIVLTWRTLHGFFGAVGPIWTGKMTVAA